MKKFTDDEVLQIAIAGGWDYHSPAKPLPMAKDSDAKAYMTYHWETPDGLGEFEGPDLDNLNVVMALVKRYLETNKDYSITIDCDNSPRVVLIKNHRIIYEEIVEYSELSNCIVKALWVAIKHKSRGKI